MINLLVGKPSIIDRYKEMGIHALSFDENGIEGCTLYDIQPGDAAHFVRLVQAYGAAQTITKHQREEIQVEISKHKRLDI